MCALKKAILLSSNLWLYTYTFHAVICTFKYVAIHQRCDKNDCYIIVI